MTTTERNLGIGIVLAVATVGVLLFVIVHGKHQEDIADAQYATERFEADRQMRDLGAMVQSVAQKSDADVSAIVKKREAVKTPADAVRSLPDVLRLPKPVEIQTEEAHLQVQVGDAVVPEADLKPLYDALSERVELQVKLEASEKQLSLSEQQLAVMQRDRDAAVTALKGGTRWKRAWTVMKWTAIGAGIGYAAARR